jgi:hypothetical protein
MFVTVVNKMLISKLSFRQAGGSTCEPSLQAGPHAAFLQVTSMLLFERELQYHYSEDGILREARAIYSIATARSKNIRICLSNPIYNFDEGRELSEPA